MTNRSRIPYTGGVIAAMQVQGPGSVGVADGLVVFCFSASGRWQEIVLDLSGLNTMGKVCGSISYNPLVALACALTKKSYELIKPLPEFENHRAYLIGALGDDPSNTLKNMPQTCCDCACGITLYTKGLLI